MFAIQHAIGGTSFHALVGGGQGEYIYEASHVIPGGEGGVSFQGEVVSLHLVACKGVVVIGLGLQFPNLEGGKGNHSFDCHFASHCLKALRLLQAQCQRERQREMSFFSKLFKLDLPFWGGGNFLFVLYKIEASVGGWNFSSSKVYCIINHNIHCCDHGINAMFKYPSRLVEN